MTRSTNSLAVGDAAAAADTAVTTVSSNWTVTIDLASLKRPVRPPSSDEYSKWSLDQLKLECTASNPNVIKNTKNYDRVAILKAWNSNNDGVEALLLRQRKQMKDESHEEAKRTKGCMFRLLNVLSSDLFYEALLRTGNQLSREEIDQKGSTADVAASFGADTDEFNIIISPESIFEDIDGSFAIVHSAAKLKRMWKEVSSSFVSAEPKSKVSGQGSNEFWDFCGGRADMYYLDRCIYPDDGDDSTNEGQPTKPTVNRKQQKTSHSSEILERVNTLLENETTDIPAVQEDACDAVDTLHT
ncbi:LOW QUALITY PROTEIN: hypothetical protein PHMEG_00037775, partial [Phytophthora megakarya]